MASAHASPTPVIVIAGPTGTGKSALALAVARALDGVIINADSRQVYADFPIVTAQPSVRDFVLATHKLYAFLPIRKKLSAGAYALLAKGEIAAARKNGRLPILVGGTGLYLRSLLSGIAPIPPVDPAISRRWQEECDRRGPNALHALLEERDPETASRLHPNDSQRITRALEVLESTGRPLGYWHSLPVPPSMYHALSFCMDLGLDAITPRLEGRIDAMLAQGAVEEARKAYDRCPDPDAPGWSGIGCAELFKYITGQTDLDTCKAVWLQNTRAYAKRQITWFKRETAMIRCKPDEADLVLRLAAETFGECAKPA
ncbi:MAG: tRNA (adenosine(37)-N6)-dimethylallyltransferase MiaA [Deltaproteobacteria bacterium]|nr:tRNA (adenosine(37)-N6)-dimethylallyltransferase MiaA [Deltaproteobacteria bacterium]